MQADVERKASNLIMNKLTSGSSCDPAMLGGAVRL